MTRHDFGAVVDIDTKGISENDDFWTITGYGSVFNNTDLGNDVVMPGAFAKSLRERGLPTLLFNHKAEDAPIGTVVEAKEDKRGLWFKAELPKEDSFVSGRIVPQLKRRGLKGTSIGYKAIKHERRKTDNARLLKEISLYEISVVNFPMNPEAGVDGIKGVVAFQDLPIDTRSRSWDAEAALTRVRALTKSEDGPSSEYQSAFLYVDPDNPDDHAGYKFLIADVDENNRLVVNPVAVYKAVALICGARSGDLLPEEAEDAVKGNLERYYSRLNLESPFKSLSTQEFQSLDGGEREARLRGLGISQRLAKQLLSGQRDADRSASPRDVGSMKEASDFLAAFKTLAAAINTPR